MNLVGSFIYRVSEWIMRLAFVNFLWIGFSLLGIVLFGFFPSTVAMFAVIRKWILGQSDIPILKTFWNTYKSEWIRSNGLGGILVGIGFFIYFEFSIINQATQPLLQWSKYPLFLLVLLFSLVILYVFPIYVHYDVSLFQVLKNALFIMLLNPMYTAVIVLSLALMYFLVNILPALAVFFGGSASAVVIMWSCNQGIIQVERKRSPKVG